MRLCLLRSRDASTALADEWRAFGHSVQSLDCVRTEVLANKFMCTAAISRFAAYVVVSTRAASLAMAHMVELDRAESQVSERLREAGKQVSERLREAGKQVRWPSPEQVFFAVGARTAAALTTALRAHARDNAVYVGDGLAGCLQLARQMHPQAATNMRVAVLSSQDGVVIKEATTGWFRELAYIPLYRRVPLQVGESELREALTQERWVVLSVSAWRALLPQLPAEVGLPPLVAISERIANAVRESGYAVDVRTLAQLHQELGD
jgi:uroporphyrinogen-III synthase